MPTNPSASGAGRPFRKALVPRHVATQRSDGNAAAGSQPGIPVEGGSVWDFGAQTIRGVVISVDGPYLAKQHTHWTASALKGLIVIGVIAPIVIVVSIAGKIWSLYYFGRSGNRQRSLAAEFGRQFSVSYVMTRIFRPADQMTVRDVRVRDSNGQEHLVRVRGELVYGGFSVGDEVEVTGFNRQGTLLLRSGWNRRTRSKLLVRAK